MIKNKRKKVIATVATALSLTTLGVVSATAFYNVNSWTKLTLKYRNKNEDVFIDSIKVKSGSTWGQVLPLLKDNKFVDEICQNENWRIDEYGAKIDNKVITYSDRLAGNKTIMLNFMPRESRQVNIELHFYFTKGIIDWENANEESKINFSTIKKEIETRFKAKLRNFGEKMFRIELARDQHNSDYDVVVLKINNIYISSNDKSIVEKMTNDSWEINLKQLFISKGFIKEETFKIENNKKTSIDYPFYCSEQLNIADFKNSVVFGNDLNKIDLKHTNNTFKIRYDISPRIKIFDISIDRTNGKHAKEVESLLNNDKLDNIFEKQIFKSGTKNELLPPEKFSKTTGQIGCDDFIRSYAINKKYNTKLISSNPNTPLINLYFISENTLYKVPEEVKIGNTVYDAFKNYWESSKEGEICLYTNTNLYNYEIKVVDKTFKVKRKIVNNEWTLDEEDLEKLAIALGIDKSQEWFEESVKNYITFYKNDDLKEYIIKNNVNLSFSNPKDNNTKYEKIVINFYGRDNERSIYELGKNGKTNQEIRIENKVDITVKQLTEWANNGGRSNAIVQLNDLMSANSVLYSEIKDKIKSQYKGQTSNVEYYTSNLDNVNYKIVDYTADIPTRTIRLSFAKFLSIQFNGQTPFTKEIFKKDNEEFKLNYYDKIRYLTNKLQKDDNYFDDFICNANSFGLFFVDSNKATNWNKIKNQLKMPIWKYEFNSVGPLSTITDQNNNVITSWISAKLFKLTDNYFIIMPDLNNANTLNIVKEYCGIKNEKNINIVFQTFIKKYISNSKSEFISRFENILSNANYNKKVFYHDSKVANSSIDDKFDIITNYFYGSNSNFFDSFVNDKYTFNISLKNIGFKKDNITSLGINNLNKEISVTYDIVNKIYEFNTIGFFATNNINKIVDELFKEKDNIFKYPLQDLDYEKCRKEIIEKIKNDIQSRLTNAYISEIDNECDLSKLNIRAGVNYPSEYRDKNIEIVTLESKTLKPSGVSDFDSFKKYNELKNYLNSSIWFLEYKYDKWVTATNKDEIIIEIYNRIKEKIANSSKTANISLSDIFANENYQGKKVKIVKSLEFLTGDSTIDDISYGGNWLSINEWKIIKNNLYTLINARNLFNGNQQKNFDKDLENLFKDYNLIQNFKIILNKQSFPSVQWSIKEKSLKLKINDNNTKEFKFTDVQNLKKLLTLFFKSNYENKHFGLFEINSTNEVSEKFVKYICDTQIANEDTQLELSNLIDYYNNNSGNKRIVNKKYKEFQYFNSVNNQYESINYFECAGDWNVFVSQLQSKIDNLENYYVLNVIKKNHLAKNISNTVPNLSSETNISSYEKNDEKIIRVEDIKLNDTGTEDPNTHEKEFERFFLISLNERKIRSNGEKTGIKELKYDEKITKWQWLIRQILQDGLLFADKNEKEINRLKGIFTDEFEDFNEGKKSLYEIIKNLLEGGNQFIFDVNSLDVIKNVKNSKFIMFENSEWSEESISHLLFNEDITKNLDKIYNFLFDNEFLNKSIFESTLSNENFEFEVSNQNDKPQITLKIKKFRHFSKKYFNWDEIENNNYNNVLYAITKKSEIIFDNVDNECETLLDLAINDYIEKRKNEILLYSERMKTTDSWKNQWKEYYLYNDIKKIKDSIINYVKDESVKSNTWPYIKLKDFIDEKIKKELPKLIFKEPRYFEDATLSVDNNNKYKISFGNTKMHAADFEKIININDIWPGIKDFFVFKNKNIFEIKDSPAVAHNFFKYFEQNQVIDNDEIKNIKRTIVNRINKDLQILYKLEIKCKFWDIEYSISELTLYQNIEKIYDAFIKFINEKYNNDTTTFSVKNFVNEFNAVNVGDEVWLKNV